MALTLGYKQALHLKLQPVGYKNFLGLVDKEPVLERGRKLLNDNRHPDVDEHESCCYLGINYTDWVQAYGEEAAARNYAEGGRRSFLPLRFMGKVIDHLRPSVVVSTSSPRSEQAAIEAAVKRGIPSLTMMDLFALPHDLFLQQKVHADRITVLSEFVKRNLVTAGIEDSRIKVTGCPAYDPMFDSANIEAGQAFRSKMGWDGLRVVMWAGNLEEDGPGVTQEYRGTALGIEVEKRLRAWVGSHPDTALLVRYHPNQYHYFPRLEDHPRVYVSNPAADRLHPQLHAADVVIVQTSTVGFEAALIGKRVLALSFSPMVKNFKFDYGELGLGESVSSMSDLTMTIENSPTIARDCSAFPPPGLATPRVARVILSLLSPKKN